VQSTYSNFFNEDKSKLINLFLEKSNFINCSKKLTFKDDNWLLLQKNTVKLGKVDKSSEPVNSSRETSK
jgi:hypothetical protein